MARKKHPESGNGDATGNGELQSNAAERAILEGRWHVLGDAHPPRKRPKNYEYVDELVRLQFELLKMQEWVRLQGLKLCVLFEGRDAAGKGGVIKRITECLNPRVCRVVALGTPTERERSQWYFQRYVPHLPSAGEIVLFDRSWYNRAGVEHVMGFCSDKEYQEFLRACPQFEEMLVRSGIVLVKYWFWKLSPMDLEARKHWVEYSKAKDVMLEFTDRKIAPWYIVDADSKKRARLNCIAHLLTQIPYKDLRPVAMDLPARQPDNGYKRPKKSSQRWVEQIY